MKTPNIKVAVLAALLLWALAAWGQVDTGSIAAWASIPGVPSATPSDRATR